ncbi:PilZ domain-containing protein [Alterisphingorhabdus coralli]|uniref:PilZ domain-containing protein n=1 Tax=Alterisphingorhabdus coralli TaxID=3071408 RepID=A0AA97F5L2_9SPHN|nr:PilZ domain-containing protein [Parasphingorhabdus sp. SCSIO 66989]WOE74398.1 PilZ domain-containing protein [Parasphingorhabdus sp. SCSIO 66989]
MGIWEKLPENNADSQDSERDNRHERRDALFLLARVSFENSEKTIDVRVRNLSAGGMMAESNVYCAPGDIVTVTIIHSEPIAGRISWQSGGRFGVAFNHPIDPQSVRDRKTAAIPEKPSHLRLMEQKAARKAKRVRRI